MEAGRAGDAGEQGGDRAYERSHSSNSSRSSSCCKGSSEEGEARADSSNEGAGKEACSDGEGGGEKWEEERGRSMQRDARQSSRASPRSLTAAIVAAEGGSGKWCFYEVLAAGYEAQPEEAEELLPLFAPLWSIPFCSQVFTLLLHRWVREGGEGGGSFGSQWAICERYSEKFVLCDGFFSLAKHSHINALPAHSSVHL